MNENWQSIAALAVVLVTLAVFILRALKPKPPGSCGGGCGCDRKSVR